VVFVLLGYQHGDDYVCLDYVAFQCDKLQLAFLVVAILLDIWRVRLRLDYIYLVLLHAL